MLHIIFFIVLPSCMLEVAKFECNVLFRFLLIGRGTPWK